VLAYFSEERSDATLLWLFVASAHRGQHIATALLRRLDAELRALGCRHVRTDYAVEGRNSVILERLFRNHGWENPVGSHVSCNVRRDDFRRLLQAPWVQRCHLPRDFSLFPWCEAGEEELDALRRHSPDSPLYRTRFDPFIPGKCVDPLTSVGLRHNGEIVGWMLTERRDPPGGLLYDRLYVMHRFQATSRAIPVLVESMKRHWKIAGHLDTMSAWFRTELDNAPMMAFIRRRLGPFLTSAVEVNLCSKSLTA